MLRSFIAIIFLLLFAGQLFNRSILLLNYAMNKKFFMERCENKARPMLHCDGKCLLMKKIKEAENREQQDNPERLPVVRIEVHSSRSFFPGLIQRPAIVFSFKYAAENDRSFPVGITAEVFHPPGVA